MKKIENIALAFLCVFMFNALTISAQSEDSILILKPGSSTKDVLAYTANHSKFSNDVADTQYPVMGIDTVGDDIPDSVAKFNWTPIINGIIQVESKGNPKAVSGLSVGVMQITPVLVSDCNRILRRRKCRKRFSLRDRWSVSKSKEMFLIFQSFYNPLNDLERAIRSWNGGVHYSIKRTQRYFEKVMAAMKAL
nr:lytic transglycosylase domain-containing protein [uncultured Prevotella sp.]